MVKITVNDFQKMKDEGEKITMLTAYTYPFARIMDEVGVDSILVGDSLGMTVLGYPNTLPVTIDDTIRCCQAVSRGVKHALLIGDMPFLTYGISINQTVENAGKIVKEGNCDAIKLEGGRERVDEIEAIREIGIPVLGHIGLTPTYVNLFGGYKVQGKKPADAERLLEDAKLLEEAGVFAIVLESIPWKLAKQITESLTVPTIGIGAGEYCDGQVLVIDDILGLTFDFKPKFVKQYVNLRETISKAVDEYIKDVKEGKYPAEEHRYE